MFRLLVVEDQVEFYQEYLLRIFEKMLPMENFSVVHVPTLDSAIRALTDPWDMILMDYSLGPKTEFMGEPVRDGADLVSFRRAIEEQQELPKAYILGMSSNEVGNRLMLDKGADSSRLKLEIPQMAEIIRNVSRQA